MGTIDARFSELGIVLPRQPPPAGAYVPHVVVGGVLFVSGQLPMLDGEIKYTGRVGAEVAIDTGYAAARLCGLNLLAHVREACGGNLDQVVRVVKLSGFVQCSADFTDHPKVVNGASELMMEIFGEAGRHARIAIGAPSLPLNAAVEVDGIFQIG